jgi:hypothetical protein
VTSRDEGEVTGDAVGLVRFGGFGVARVVPDRFSSKMIRQLFVDLGEL